jgi:hypothetical protein
MSEISGTSALMGARRAEDAKDNREKDGRIPAPGDGGDGMNRQIPHWSYRGDAVESRFNSRRLV